MAFRSSLFRTLRNWHYGSGVSISTGAVPSLNCNPSLMALSITAERGFKTSSTEHPEPVFNQDEQILEKVIKERHTDLPESLANPYEKPIRKCILCEHQIVPNYKNVKLLYQFVSPYTGLVYPRNVTGLCNQMQEILQREIRLAQRFGFMAYYLKEVEFLKDPKLCDPEKPVRPHKY